MMFHLVVSIAGFVIGIYLLQYALVKSNGKKPVRLLSAFLVLSSALIYALSVANIIDIRAYYPLMESFVPVFFLVLVWETRIDSEGGHN